MKSILPEFRALLSINGLSLVGFLRLLSQRYGIQISRGYLYKVLAHPENLQLGYLKAFADILKLDEEQQQNLFLTTT